MARELDILAIIRRQRIFTAQMIGLLSSKQIALCEKFAQRVVDSCSSSEDDNQDLSENSQKEIISQKRLLKQTERKKTFGMSLLVSKSQDLTPGEELPFFRDCFKSNEPFFISILEHYRKIDEKFLIRLPEQLFSEGDLENHQTIPSPTVFNNLWYQPKHAKVVPILNIPSQNMMISECINVCDGDSIEQTQDMGETARPFSFPEITERRKTNFREEIYSEEGSPQHSYMDDQPEQVQEEQKVQSQDHNSMEYFEEKEESGDDVTAQANTSTERKINEEVEMSNQLQGSVKNISALDVDV